MNRRKFIFQTGASLTATALMSFSNERYSINSKKNISGKTNIRKDIYSTFETPILQAIAIGLNAPSAHNTQAWKFKIISETEALFYVDENRLLPETDPPARQIHISCGCFIEALTIGCTGLKYESNVKLFPEGEYKNNEIGLKPLALIKLIKSTVSIHPLWDSIFKRRMSRTEYYSEFIEASVHEKIEIEAEIHFSKTKFINDDLNIKSYSEIFAKAMKVEYDTVSKNEETRRMFRFNHAEAETKRDGLTFEANGIVGFPKILAQTFTKNTMESWNKKSTKEAGYKSFMNGLNFARGFIIFVSNNNSLTSQINVGRDFYRYALALTKHGYYMHPLNQALQEYLEMDEIRNNLDVKYGTKGAEKIQMIARIGKCAAPFESYRRHLNSFIIK